MIWYFPANNYLFKVSSLSTIIRCESCSNEGSRMMWMTLFAVFIVKCEHVLHIVLIVDFEQLSVCQVHIKITNTFKSKIRYLMHYVVVFSVWKKFINKLDVNLYHRNPMDKSVRNSWEGVYFRRWLWLQRCGSHLNICLFTDFARWKIIRSLLEHWQKLFLTCKLLLSCSITIVLLNIPQASSVKWVA